MIPNILIGCCTCINVLDFLILYPPFISSLKQVSNNAGPVDSVACSTKLSEYVMQLFWMGARVLARAAAKRLPLLLTPMAAL